MIDDSSNSPAGGGIQIDSDWKAEAQREKEKLAARRAAEAAEKAAASVKASPTAAGESGSPAGGGAGGGAGPREMPEANFKTLVSSLASQALMYMGAYPDPRGQSMVSLDVARFNIDLLAVLQDKTAGNATEAEKSMLAATLYELRMTYVEVGNAVREQTIANAGLPPRG
jgi:hypothetical protein